MVVDGLVLCVARSGADSSLYGVVATERDGTQWLYTHRVVDSLEDAQRVARRMAGNLKAGQFETRYIWSRIDSDVKLYASPWDQM